jgi:phosphate transport system permease protein
VKPKSSLRAWIGSPIALIPLILVGLVAIVLLYASGLHDFGGSFWSFNYNFIPGDPSASSWGIGTFVVGTALTAGLALVLATALSLALSISIVVYLPTIPSRVLTVLTNLLAGIPSVVYGIWGFVILAPYFGFTLEPTLRSVIGWLPGFGGPASEIGPWGILLAVFILTIMIIPLTTALMREALWSVPRDLVEAGLALGATRWEVARRVRMHSARLGIASAILLGFGRAVGESVAVAMVIGAVPKLPLSVYSESTTIASFVFYQLDSAFLYPDLLELLVEYALFLLLIAVGVNLLAQRLTRAEIATATTVGAAERLGGGAR